MQHKAMHCSVELGLFTLATKQACLKEGLAMHAAPHLALVTMIMIHAGQQCVSRRPDLPTEMGLVRHDVTCTKGKHILSQ